MAHVRSSDLLGQVRTLFCAGTVAGLTDAQMNDVLRAAVAVRLKAAAAVLLALALAGATVAAAGAGVGSGARKQAGDRGSGREPAVASNPVPGRPADHRPADEIVKEIEVLLKAARRGLYPEESHRTHSRIAALVDDLRTAYPDDPRSSRYLPERWRSLNFIDRRAEVYAEISAVLNTTNDPVLKKDALFTETSLRFLEPIDGPAAVSLAEGFARQAPGDNRAGELLYQAATKLDPGWFTRVGLVATLAVAGALTVATARKRRAGTRRLLKLAVRLGELALVMLVALLCGFRLLANDRFAAIIRFVHDKLSDTAMHQRAMFIASSLWNEGSQQLQSIAWSRRTALVVALAAATALILVGARKRLVDIPMRWTSAVRLGIVGFIVVLALSCAVDGCLIARRQDALRDRVVREYPDSLRGRLVQGERRQRERIGEPFELGFVDAISGRPISMKALRGKVVVVDFWATWCGPCVGEIPELKRLYAEYHDKGVEFIGVSHDLPEEDGGLEELKEFVARQKITWPQFYQALDNSRWARTGSARNAFSDSWGISGIPTVFLIDAEGKLYSTEARGKLDTLIPRLLKQSRASSSGR